MQMVSLFQNPCGRDSKEKNSTPAENLTPAVHPELSCYTARPVSAACFSSSVINLFLSLLKMLFGRSLNNFLCTKAQLWLMSWEGCWRKWSLQVSKHCTNIAAPIEKKNYVYIFLCTASKNQLLIQNFTCIQSVCKSSSAKFELRTGRVPMD